MSYTLEINFWNSFRNDVYLRIFLSFLALMICQLCLSLAAIAQTESSNVQNNAQRARTHEERVRQANQNTITLTTGTLESTYARIGSDLANVLNRQGGLRILPVLSAGPLQALDDILYLKGVDIGIIRADVLDFVDSNEPNKSAKNQITYIANLFNEEIHLLADERFANIGQLAGKKINFGLFNNGTRITAQNILQKMNIDVNPTYYDQPFALEKLRTGEIDAMFVVDGKPSSFIRSITRNDGIQLLPIPYTVDLSEVYIPAKLNSNDYPNLINQDQEISTIAVGAIIAAYNWRTQNVRYANVARFVEGFIANFDNFLHPSRHRKWREVDIAAETPGLQRFPLVQKLIEDFSLNKQQPDSLQNIDRKDLEKEFYSFAIRTFPDKSINDLSKAESEKLFRQFTSWRESKRIEVLHYWSSPGESKAVGVIRDHFENTGGKWIDSTIEGGGGGLHAIVLRSRLLSGTAPDAIQLKGQTIQKYAQQGILADLTPVATEEAWDSFLLPQIQRYSKFNDRYVSVPVNIHRVDWIWANPEAFKKIGARIPTSWSAFNETAGKLQDAGITPLAIGGEPWQEATLFEVVVLGIGGADFYKDALIDLDRKAIASSKMKAVFNQMRILRGFVDPAYKGRSWNDATAMVMNGKAAMQVMGDWAKGEFAAAEKIPEQDYLCIPAWSDGGFILNSDSFVFFDSSSDKNNAGQELLAKSVLSKRVQEEFNLAKGSIPARSDVPLDKFDACAKKSRQDLELASSLDGLVGSVAHEIAHPPGVRQAFLDIVSAHFNSDMSSEEAVRQLADALARAQR